MAGKLGAGAAETVRKWVRRAESTVGSFKTELIRRQGPWCDVDHVEIETLNWVDWFNTERLHVSLDDLTPAAAEQFHYDHRRTLGNSRVTQEPSLRTRREESKPR